MPRHKRHDRPVEKIISFPQSIVEQVDASLRDPLTQRTRFGGWSELLTTLLSKWLDGEVKCHIEPFRMNLDDLVEDK